MTDEDTTTPPTAGDGPDPAPTDHDRSDSTTAKQSRTNSTTADHGRTDSRIAFTSILETALALLRRQPVAVVPFVLAGLVGAASTLARVESPYPVGVAPFPRDGIVRLSVPLVPALEPMLEIGPSSLLGLKSQFFAALVGWQVAISLVTAVAFAVVSWMVARETSGIVPPLSRIGWLFVYALVVQGLFFAMLSVTVQWVGGGFWVLPLLLVVPIGVGLFLAPAYIVLDGARPIAAARKSVASTEGRPLSIAGLLLGIGYLGYALTGASHAVPESTLGTAVGTVGSVAIAGTAHAAIVVAASRHDPIDR